MILLWKKTNHCEWYKQKMPKIFAVEPHADPKVIFLEISNAMTVHYENKVFGSFLVSKKCAILWFEALLVEFS